MMIISHTVTKLKAVGHCYFFEIKSLPSGDVYFKGKSVDVKRTKGKSAKKCNVKSTKRKKTG